MAWQSAHKELEQARSSANEAEQKEFRAMKSGVPLGPEEEEEEEEEEE